MWMLDFLPAWIFHLIVIAGIGGLIVAQFIKFIPLVTQYRLFIQIGSIIVLAFGLYMEGGVANQQKWEARVKELEAQVAISENKSKDANIQLASVVKEKTKVVKEFQVVIQDRIVREADKIDADCKVAPEVISILNDAAKGSK
jgi:uncharacterized coiled-coil protein SlyX